MSTIRLAFFDIPAVHSILSNPTVRLATQGDSHGARFLQRDHGQEQPTVRLATCPQRQSQGNTWLQDEREGADQRKDMQAPALLVSYARAEFMAQCAHLTANG